MRIEKTLLCLLTLALSAMAQAGVTIQQWTAPSGARVYFIENHDLPILDVQADFAAGTLFSPADKTGLAGLTNGLLDNGAGDLNEEQIADKEVDLAIALTAHADADRAGLSLRTLATPQVRDQALDLLHLLLTRPTFPADVLAREKAHAIAALEEADTHPDSIAAKRCAAALYGDHPYGRSATAASLSAITRDDLVDFHRRTYAAKRAVIALVGDVSRAEAEAIAQRLTADLPAGDPVGALPSVTLPQAAIIRIPHPAAQAHILIGLPANRRDDPDYFPLLVGNYTLGGGGFVSRLMNEVREKRGYAYDIHSYFSPRLEQGPFEIGLQTRRDQADAALKLSNEVLIGFLKSGPTAAELKAAQQNIADGLALRIDSNAKLLGILAAIGYYHLPLDYLDTYAKQVKAVTSDQVRAAFARKVRPEHLVTVIVAGDEAAKP